MMNNVETSVANISPSHIDLPDGLTSPVHAYPTFFIHAGGATLRNPNEQLIYRANVAIRNALQAAHPANISGQCLLKVHIGEPACATRMKPAYMNGSIQFLLGMGGSGVIASDTTVAYTGDRGHKANTQDDSSTYLKLATKHGWSVDGPAKVPFVVLDRPKTSIADEFVFKDEKKLTHISGINRFSDFYLAGGFAAADFVINHAHLTLHGLAGVAGCVKSIAMGCSSLKGKPRGIRRNRYKVPYQQLVSDVRL